MGPERVFNLALGQKSPFQTNHRDDSTAAGPQPICGVHPPTLPLSINDTQIRLWLFIRWMKESRPEPIRLDLLPVHVTW